MVAKPLNNVAGALFGLDIVWKFLVDSVEWLLIGKVLIKF